MTTIARCEEYSCTHNSINDKGREKGHCTLDEIEIDCISGCMGYQLSEDEDEN